MPTLGLITLDTRLWRQIPTSNTPYRKLRVRNNAVGCSLAVDRREGSSMSKRTLRQGTGTYGVTLRSEQDLHPDGSTGAPQGPFLDRFTQRKGAKQNGSYPTSRSRKDARGGWANYLQYQAHLPLPKLRGRRHISPTPVWCDPRPPDLAPLLVVPRFRTGELPERVRPPPDRRDR